MNNSLEFVRVSHPLPKSKIPVGKMTPEQAAAYRGAHAEAKQKSEQWLAQNPRSSDNIVAHWDQSTPEHKDQGMSWYPDAHHAATVMARDKGISVNQAAGLIANYSPQQHWAQNLRMASLAAGGQIIGGPKTDPTQEGFMASASQAEAAKRILGGEDYHDIFRGKKIKSFGHLIEHGGDTEPNDPKVVVDRHALGVAHGGFADDGVYTHSKVSAGVRKDGSSPVYDEVSQMYKDAADKINARDGGHNGVPIEPHQLQAATWLTRQRLNAEGGYSGDEESSSKGGTQAKIAEGYTNKWNQYAAQNHPELVNKVPGTGFSNAVGQGGMANPEQFTAPAKPALVASKFANDWKLYPAGGNNAMTMTHPAGFGSAMVLPHSQGGFSAYHTDITDPSMPVDAGRFKNLAEAQQAAAHGLMKNNTNPTSQHPMNFLPSNNYSLSKITRKSSKLDDSKTWNYDALSDQFKTSNLDAKFSCNCGKVFTPVGYKKCACGQAWASFDIIPQDKTAAKVIRIMRTVKDHNRILAKTADMAGIIGGEEESNAVGADDDEKYRDADSQHQQGDRENSVSISNEYTEGVKPNSSVPFFIRKNQEDAAPVVLEKQSNLPYVRSVWDDEANYQEKPSLSDLPARDFKGPKPAKHDYVDPNYDPNEFELHPNVRRTADLNDGMPGGTVQIPTTMPNKPRHLNPVDPNLGKPNQWITHPNNNQQSILTPNGSGSVIPYPNEAIGLGNNFHNGNPVDTIQPNADAAKNEVEKNLVDPNTPMGRHHANKKVTMSFDEDEFKLGYILAENEGRLPKTASRSFVEGYIEALREVVSDRAPGWDTVAPAFEKPTPGINNSMSDFTDAKPATDDGSYHEVRKELGDKLDRNNAAGQSRDDQGKGINRPTTDLEGWKTSGVDLSQVHVAALAREIARRSNNA